MSETGGRQAHVPANFTEVLHPLVQHKLTRMRMKDTSTASFRDLLREISLLLAYELLRDLPIEQVEIEIFVGQTSGEIFHFRQFGAQHVALGLEAGGIVEDFRPPEQAVIPLHGGKGEIGPQSERDGEHA